MNMCVFFIFIPCWYNCHPHTGPESPLQALLLSSALRRAISIIGAARAFANASITMDDCGSVRIAVPIDMKKLHARFVSQRRRRKKRSPIHRCREGGGSNPKVAAEPSIYWPRLRMNPLGPGPFFIRAYPPIIYHGRQIPSTPSAGGSRLITEKEANAEADTCTGNGQ